MSKNFTSEQLRTIYEVCERKDLAGKWENIAQILNARFGTNWGESTYRKRYCWFKEMLNACKNIVPECTRDTTEADIVKRELEQAKIQFRDERNAWNRQNYTNARVTQKLDYLESVIKDQNHLMFTTSPIKKNNNKKAVICCSDWHIGECFNNEWGSYNADIAKERLEKYASECLRRCEIEDISDVIIANVGDSISGSIHKSIQVTNRENVIEQIMLASELMLGFVSKFVEIGYNVKFTNVAGNHTRIDLKADAIKDERMDDLIGWYVNSHLSRYDNFTYIKAQDNTLAEVDSMWFVHGDYDSFSKRGLADLVMFKGYKPNAVFMGHMHSFGVDSQYDIPICRSGCLAGSGNDYTIEKRLSGSASQLMAIAEDGVPVQFYNFVL